MTMWKPCSNSFASPLLRTARALLCRLYSIKNHNLQDGPGLKDFVAPISIAAKQSVPPEKDDRIPYLQEDCSAGDGRKVYFETYGCQMNVSDTEIAWSVLKDAGYHRTTEVKAADVILAVTCAVRENAERKVWSRLDYFRSLKKRRPRSLPPLRVGLLGCMAERLKTKLLETDKMVDVVAGPDSYRDLPRLLSVTESGQAAAGVIIPLISDVNVMLSMDETYADIMPVRINKDSPSAYVSIMRGCDNMCSFCIVPFTRGRERSRSIDSILSEIRMLSNEGVKEVTLLGQNVNSYRDTSQNNIPVSYGTKTHLSKGFQTIYKTKEGGRRFADLLDKVAMVDPEMRVRFTSPHPKDFPDELLYLIRDRPNICGQVHLPAQSGNSKVLERMRRGYTREAYLDLVGHIRSIVPGVTLSSDFITGFCGETEEEHRDTLSLMETVQFDMAYMFAYSMRKKTHAYHRMTDDVPEEAKKRRLRELVEIFYPIAAERNRRFIGTDQLVLVESTSKKSDKDLAGRMDGNTKIIFPNIEVPCEDTLAERVTVNPGDYVHVKVTDASSISLRGIPIARTSLQTFHRLHCTDNSQIALQQS